jgi:hypothetical protein
MWDENLPGSGKLREALLRGGYPWAEFQVGIPPQAGHLPVVLRGFTRATLALPRTRATSSFHLCYVAIVISAMSRSFIVNVQARSQINVELSCIKFAAGWRLA